VLAAELFGNVFNSFLNTSGELCCALCCRPLVSHGGGWSRLSPFSSDSVILVGIEDDAAADIARRAADGLDERRLRAQESFFIGIKNCHELDLGQVEAFTQQVHPYEHVIFALSQVGERRDAVERLDVAVQIGRLELCDPSNIRPRSSAIFFVSVVMSTRATFYQ
jgi:hypothetical protein